MDVEGGADPMPCAMLVIVPLLPEGAAGEGIDQGARGALGEDRGVKGYVPLEDEGKLAL